MHHLLLLAGILLLPKVYTLRCYECLSESSIPCTGRSKDCPPLADRCIAIRQKTYAGGSLFSDVNGKHCSFAEECAQGSVNFGVSRSVITSQCCTTNLCNDFPAPEEILAKPNGKKCYTCNGQQCDATLECLAEEYHCISMTVESGGQTTSLKGCASEEVCANLNQLGRYTGSSQFKVGTQMSCCEGNYCNSGSRATVGLLLLVGPLLSFMMWP
ncbi:urokinase plasminogen activator surface receptor-like [Festucalex cinctus]